MHVCHAREQYFRWLLVTKDPSPHTIRAYETRTGMWSGNVGGWNQMGAFYGRQQSKSPETKVAVAGHRAGMVEPKDQARLSYSSPSGNLKPTGCLDCGGGEISCRSASKISSSC